MNDEQFLRLMHEASDPLLRLVRAEVRDKEASLARVQYEVERVKQDKPMSRKGDRT